MDGILLSRRRAGGAVVRSLLGDDGRWRGVLSDPLSFPHTRYHQRLSLPPPPLVPGELPSPPSSHAGCQRRPCAPIKPAPNSLPSFFFPEARRVSLRVVRHSSGSRALRRRQRLVCRPDNHAGAKQLRQQKTRSQPGLRRPSNWRTLCCLSRPRRS
jgi:hypothetical protein